METKDVIHLIDATGLIIVQALLIHWSPLRDVVLGIFRFFHFSSGTRSIPEVREGGLQSAIKRRPSFDSVNLSPWREAATRVFSASQRPRLFDSQLGLEQRHP